MKSLADEYFVLRTNAIQRKRFQTDQVRHSVLFGTLVPQVLFGTLRYCVTVRYPRVLFGTLKYCSVPSGMFKYPQLRTVVITVCSIGPKFAT